MEKLLRIFAKQKNVKKIKNGHFSSFWHFATTTHCNFKFWKIDPPYCVYCKISEKRGKPPTEAKNKYLKSKCHWPQCPRGRWRNIYIYIIWYKSTASTVSSVHVGDGEIFTFTLFDINRLPLLSSVHVGDGEIFTFLLFDINRLTLLYSVHVGDGEL